MQKITSTFEFKVSVALSLLMIALAAFYSQELDFFAAASPEFMFVISLLVLLVLTMFMRSLSMLLFNRHLYNYPSIPFIIMLVAILIIVFFPFTRISIDNEFRHNINRRKIAVDKVYFKEWPIDKYGGAKLPLAYVDLSLDSTIRFCDDDGVITAVFITFKQNTRAAAIVYIEGLKQESELGKEVNRKDQFPYYPIKFRKLAENWYAISSDKDFFSELNW